MEGIITGILLGVVQGATEFLPISSTGHLILTRSLFGIEDTHALAFDAILHLATAAAVIVYFIDDLWNLLQTLLRKIGRLPVNEKDARLLYALIVGTIPAVVLGLLLESTMETWFRSPLLVAGVLVLGSLLFMLAEYLYEKRPRNADISVGKGFKIGLFQSLALVPGVSRAGASIAGGMLLGFSRSDAARFAFLLSIPIILGAGVKKLIELLGATDPVSWVAVGVGAVTSFVVGLLAIHFMLSFVRNHTLWPFIWYRLVLAAVVVLLVFTT